MDPTTRRAGQSAREMEAALIASDTRAWWQRLADRLTSKHDDERAWRMGAEGEEAVGAVLDRLARQDGGWTVLHDLPIGTRGANVDHLVLGPPGLFTINSKRTGHRVSVGKHVVFNGGSKTDHVRNARYEAARVAKLLQPLVGEVEVRPMLAYVCDDYANPHKRAPSGVTVRHIIGLARWLRREPATLSPQRRSELARAITSASLWATQAPSGVSTPPPTLDRRRVEVTSRPVARSGRPAATRQQPAPRTSAGPVSVVRPMTGTALRLLPPPRPADRLRHEPAFVDVWMGVPSARPIRIVVDRFRRSGPLLTMLDGAGRPLANACISTGVLHVDPTVTGPERAQLERHLAVELRR